VDDNGPPADGCPGPSGRPWPRHGTGGDPAGQPPAALPGTFRAADQVRRSALTPDARRRACDLLAALAAVDRSFAVDGPAGIPAGLLRDVVIISSGLIGRAWLRNDPDRSADFTALYTTRIPPPLAELDQIIATVLSTRFGLALATAAARGRTAGPQGAVQLAAAS
jgi:hypothetical protein